MARRCRIRLGESVAQPGLLLSTRSAIRRAIHEVLAQDRRAAAIAGLPLAAIGVQLPGKVPRLPLIPTFMPIALRGTRARADRGALEWAHGRRLKDPLGRRNRRKAEG